MNLRSIITGLLLALTLALGAAGTAGASTAHRAPVRYSAGASLPPEAFCLYNSDTSCWHFNGPGNAISDTTNPADYSNVYISNQNTGTGVQLVSGRGHCVYVNSSGAVKEIKANCDVNSINEWFNMMPLNTSRTKFVLVSNETSHDVWVKNSGGGYTLHATQTPTGGWYKWGYYPW